MKFRQFIFALLATGLVSQFIPRAPAQTVNAAVPTPKFEVRGYRFEGETFLPLSELSDALSNYTGYVDLPRIHAGLNRLQRVYFLNDITNVSVFLPQQTITNGILRVQILPVLATASTPKPTRKFDVRTYRIEGNTVLPPSDFGVLSNYTGTNLDFARLREGLGKIQLRYRALGFSTINVTLPQQRLTNGLVRVKVIEGRLSAITVSGNHWFSDKNVRHALPSLTTNILLNTRWFQPELDLANANRDRQIYPVISPGPDPGTTLLDLKVKDQLPLHGRIEINDKNAPDTALLRFDTAIQYGNLWQLDHQIGFDYNFSPQVFKNGSDTEIYPDAPQVATYSMFYRMPLGTQTGLREDLDNQPVTFGYDEISHRFNLPPPTGHPDLTFYASRASSDSFLQSGAHTIIFTNTLADISAQSQQHTPTIDNNLGLKLTLPLDQFLGIQSSLLFGIDFKTYAANTDSTNLTYFDLYALDQFGNRVLVTNQTLRVAANSSQALQYVPLSVGWMASRPDKYGSFFFTWNQSIFLTQLASTRSDFQNVADNSRAGGNYTTLNAGLIRQQNLFGDWTATLNVNGQWASAPLINNEQFALGGTSGVRGYEEGEAYGDSGWRALLDLHAPPVNVGYFPTDTADVPAQLRCSLFMDYGQLYSPLLMNQQISEWGTGIAFLLTAGEHFDARLTLAWALDDVELGPGSTANKVFTGTTTGSMQAYFSVGAQF